MILVNRIAPVLPFMGPSSRYATGTQTPIIYLHLRHHQVRLNTLSGFFYIYGERTATTVTIIVVLVVIALSFVATVIRKRRLKKGRVRMRIQLNPFHYPYMGGIEHRTHEISRRLSTRHEVIVLTSRLPGTAEEEVMDGYRVVRLPPASSGGTTRHTSPRPGCADALNSLTLTTLTPLPMGAIVLPAMRRYEGNWMFTFHNTYGEGDRPGVEPDQ